MLQETIPVTVCDVYRTRSAGIRRVRILVVDAEAVPVTVAGVPKIDRTLDFSPRALARLLRYVDRGMSPPRHAMLRAARAVQDKQQQEQRSNA